MNDNIRAGIIAVEILAILMYFTYIVWSMV